MVIKVLNLYAGIGGNRKFWENVEVTAIENNPHIAKIYSKRFPEDKTIVEDAEDHIINHFREYDFIWASPPCQSHSVMCYSQNKKKLPDMKLYSLIIFLQTWFKEKWVVENVIPCYNPLIKPTIAIDRHLFWSNFFISSMKLSKKKDWYIRRAQIPQLCEQHQVDYKDFEVINEIPEVHSGENQFRRRQILRNCVNPKLGLHVFNCAFKLKQSKLGK